MDRQLLENTLTKTSKGIMKWERNEGFSKAYPYSFVSKLEDGMFFVFCVPKFPLNDTEYFFGWYPAQDNGKEKYLPNPAVSTPLFTWNTVEDDGSEDRSSGTFIKDLFKLIHNKKEQEAQPKPMDLSSVKMALEKVK